MHVGRRGRHGVALPIALVVTLAMGLGGAFELAHATSHDVCVAPSPAPVAPTALSLRSYRADLASPSRLAFAPDGALYIADPLRGQVVVRAENGRVMERRSGLGNPVSLAFDGAGNLLIGDGARGSVTAYDDAWQVRYQLGIGDGEFAFPGDLAHHQGSGRTYVADSKAHAVKVYDAGGGFLFAIGGPGSEPGQFNFPAGVFVDDLRGELLVSDQLNFRVQFFTLGGAFICRVGDAAGASAGQTSFIRSRLLSVPQGLWADDLGRIYVADPFEGRVRVIDRTGPGSVGLADIGSYGEGSGALQGPSDVALDRHGRLFVAASGGSGLEIYGIDGFFDPEEIAPAQVRITPDPFDRQGDTAFFTARIEVPGYRLDEIDPAAITANGVAAELGSVAIADRNGDGEPEIEALFPRPALAATLPQLGEGRIVVAGPMSALNFEGYDVISAVGGVADVDGDGVLDDADHCPGTAAGEVVDGDGCSIAQYCPCQGPAPETDWRNHGQYVDCVDATSSRFVELGLIGLVEAEDIVRLAARMSCGKKGD